LLSPDRLQASIPAVVKHLAAKSVVAHSYAASTIEKVLTMPEKIVAPSDLAGVAEPLLKNLFAIFDVEGSRENEYVMLCVMRVLAYLGDAVVPVLAPLLPVLVAKLSAAVQNPKNPRHDHYLVEALCCSIQAACKSNPAAACESFESTLFPVFQEILQKDVAEFVPYVFQILALLLEMRNQYNLPLPEPYMALLSMILVLDVSDSLLCSIVSLLRQFFPSTQFSPWKMLRLLYNCVG
jgi:exportin-2 (importin alpha re-exporter)